MDMASYLSEASSGAERVLIDGETYRLALAYRRGFRDRWEYLFEVSAVAHRAGMFNGSSRIGMMSSTCPGATGTVRRATASRSSMPAAAEPMSISTGMSSRSGISAWG